MTLEQLSAAWRHEVSRSDTPSGFEPLLADVQEVDRVLRWRDVWIIGLLVLGVGLQFVIGWLVQPVVDPVSKVGALLFVVATTITCAVLLGARRLELADDWTLRARLHREVRKLELQQGIADRV